MTERFHDADASPYATTAALMPSVFLVQQAASQAGIGPYRDKGRAAPRLGAAIYGAVSVCDGWTTPAQTRRVA
ncbi:MAG: hypothetical protein ACRC56_13260 [Bosea sp. (in: a-proteobacteria)]